MNAIEERRALIDAAAKLEAELRNVHRRIMAISNAILSEADRLKLEAAEEVTSGETLKVTKVKFSGSGAPSQGSPDEPPPPLAKGKRACSICRRPGHRAQNCPQADEKYKADRAPKPTKKGKK